MKVPSRVLQWSWLACIPGGALWALSPRGIHLSEIKFKTAGVFWKLFPSAPLLLAAGLVALYLLRDNRHEWLARCGFWASLAGIALIVAGDVGLFYLDVDDTYMMTAPAYRAFRLGLLALAAGSILFAIAAGRDRMEPVWGTVPFAVGALCGLVSVSSDLESFGAALWTLFGIGWTWLGVSLLVDGIIATLANEKVSLATEKEKVKREHTAHTTTATYCPAWVRRPQERWTRGLGLNLGCSTLCSK